MDLPVREPRCHLKGSNVARRRGGRRIALLRGGWRAKGSNVAMVPRTTLARRLLRRDWMRRGLRLGRLGGWAALAASAAWRGGGVSAESTVFTGLVEVYRTVTRCCRYPLSLMMYCCGAPFSIVTVRGVEPSNCPSGRWTLAPGGVEVSRSCLVDSTTPVAIPAGMAVALDGGFFSFPAPGLTTTQTTIATAHAPPTTPAMAGHRRFPAG